MRRQGGNFGGESGGSYGSVASQIQQNNNKTDYYQRRHQEPHPVGEKEDRQQHNQWRRETDVPPSKLPQTAMSPTAPYSEGPRSYYQGQRLDPREPSEKQGARPLEKQGGGDGGSQAHEQDMDIGYEDDRTRILSFEGLEQKFVDDIMKLSKEQTDAEDAENARHRERTNAINARYEEQLITLRGQHAKLREDFLRRAAQVRQQQYHKVSMEQYPNSGISPNDPRGMGHNEPRSVGYNDPRGMGPNDPRSMGSGDPRRYSSGPGGEQHRGYDSEYNDSYRERGRLSGNSRDHGYEPKVPYPRGRAYDAGSRHY